MEREIDRRIGAASAVMRLVYRTVVVKKELSRKSKGEALNFYMLPPSPMVMNFGEAFQACPTGRRPREDPGHAGETMSLGWPGNASGIPPEELEEVSG
ncbi:hypothetical protein L3Q82_015434, partial [Scortum barcoo]